MMIDVREALEQGMRLARVAGTLVAACWRLCFPPPAGRGFSVRANTKSEARATLKRHLPEDRGLTPVALRPGLKIERAR